MSDLMSDIGGLYGKHEVGNHTVNIVKKGSNLDLDMTDFITLMITQMTNQGIDDTMDTSEMLNQMVQMQMVTSMVNMTDATTMNYAASLVNKTVTVGVWTSDGLQEIVGNVDAVGTMDGQTVIFVKGKYYYLSDILAVGDLSKADRTDKDGSVSDSEETGDGEVEDPDEVGSKDNPNGPGEAEETNPSETPKETETVQPGGQAETPENNDTPNDIGD